MEKISLAHGSGGRLMHELIHNLFLKKLHNPILKELSDSATLNYQEPLAFTTDSFVVNPLWFSGGDIGKLAVCGTVNDLLMQGARAEYLSLAFIIEEGLDYKVLERIVDSISTEAERIGVKVVTGDVKVVERGAADKIFINTSGVGRIVTRRALALGNIRAKDKIILTGEIAQHGLAVLAKRKELDLGFKIKSDCSSLASLLLPLLRRNEGIVFMRDPTRGGLATTLNEIAEGTGFGIMIEEKDIPVSCQAAAACELLGIDPLYVANEGKAVLVVRPQSAGQILGSLKKHPLGRKASLIGEIKNNPARRVVLNTALGTQRIVDMLSGEPLPRIC